VSRGLWLALALAGCHAFEKGQQPYYSDRSDPTFDGIDVATETGNEGGHTVVITGSGFGTDPDQLIVEIGGHNATIDSVDDGSITAVTPRGPVTGGPVALLIATPTGYTEVPGAYTYDVTLDDTTTTVSGETSYIVAENMWASCYGGMWNNPDVPDCATFAYVGATGFNGASEWFSSPYPRVETGQFGFVGSTDASLGAWHFDPHYDLAFPSADDLRKHVGDFELKNPLFDDTPVCVDPTVDPADNEVSCSDDNAVRYDEGVAQYCEGEDPIDGPDFFYSADYPIKHDFFQASADDDNAIFDPVDVELSVPASEDQAAIDTTLTLPGAIQVRGDRGFENGNLWYVSAIDTCPDENGDGQSELDEDGLDLSWQPITTPDDLGGDGVTGVHTYVQASITYLPFGWFGLTTGAPRATITVPDDNLLDADGRAHVTVPNEVLFQFQTPNTSWSAVNAISHQGTLGDESSNAAYLLIEIYRVTDYEIEAPDSSGKTVFSYVTGDMSFATWNNPVDSAADDCHDCLDGDADGWTDAQDPDCSTAHGGNGETENGANSDFTCNDGVDNNGDGLVDRDDPLCSAGWDGESTCTDGIDNDDDGWTDAADNDCSGDPNDQEDGSGTVTACGNGVDDDGDGWVDAADPGCDSGADDDEGGFLGTACNDGVDNDGHGDIDSADPYCADQGPLGDAEAPTFTSQCADGNDNDGDLFLDGFDPDCEYSPRTREYADHFDPGDEPVIPGCYDGIDNDGDGSVDGADPSCWREDLGERPDGFLNDEGADHGTGCTDGTDEDADGWIDGQDPDCVPNDPTAQDEVGYGTTLCNDGIDNNGDGLIDAASSYCHSAAGNFEGP